jgi:hypothetical protein
VRNAIFLVMANQWTHFIVCCQFISCRSFVLTKHEKGHEIREGEEIIEVRYLEFWFWRLPLLIFRFFEIAFLFLK